MEALQINHPTISDKIFNLLLSNAECDTGTDVETIGFTSTWMNHQISFYSSDSDTSNVFLDDFGYTKNGDWIQCTPTRAQYKTMLQIVTKKLYELLEEKNENLYDKDYNGCHHEYYGVNRAMFI